MSRLVVVSNRIALPDDKKSSAGGLAVGILGALRAAGGPREYFLGVVQP